MQELETIGGKGIQHYTYIPQERIINVSLYEATPIYSTILLILYRQSSISPIRRTGQSSRQRINWAIGWNNTQLCRI